MVWKETSAPAPDALGQIICHHSWQTTFGRSSVSDTSLSCGRTKTVRDCTTLAVEQPEHPSADRWMTKHKNTKDGRSTNNESEKANKQNTNLARCSRANLRRASSKARIDLTACLFVGSVSEDFSREKLVLTSSSVVSKPHRPKSSQKWQWAQPSRVHTRFPSKLP